MRIPLRPWLASGAFALALAAAPAPAAHAARPSAPALGVPAERVRAELAQRTMRTLDGRALGMDALEGEVVVVHFWATWCRPCRRELPALDALHAEIAPRGGRVLAIAIDQDAEKVKRFARENGLTLPIVADGPGGLAHRLSLNAVPCTVVLDRRGAVALVAGGSGDQVLQQLSSTARRLVLASPRIEVASDGVTR